MDISKTMMGVKEFSQAAGISEKQVRQFCHINGFPAFSAGVKLLIHFKEAEKWLAEYAVGYSLN